MSTDNADPLVFLARQKMVVEKALGVLQGALNESSMEERFASRRRASEQRREKLISELVQDREERRQSLQEVMASLGMLVDPVRQQMLDSLRIQHEAEMAAFDEEVATLSVGRDKKYRALFQFYELRAGRIEMGFPAPEPLVLMAAFAEGEMAVLSSGVKRVLERMLKQCVGLAERQIERLPEEERDAKHEDLRRLAAIQPPADAIARIRRELRMMESLAEEAKSSHQAGVILEERQQGLQSVLSGVIGNSSNYQEQKAAEIAATQTAGRADSLVDENHQREESEPVGEVTV